MVSSPTSPHLVHVHQVDARERLDPVRHPGQQLVHAHARGVVVAAEPHDNDAVLLAEDGLVDGEGVVQVGQEVGHGACGWMCPLFASRPPAVVFFRGAPGARRLLVVWPSGARARHGRGTSERRLRKRSPPLLLSSRLQPRNRDRRLRTCPQLSLVANWTGGGREVRGDGPRRNGEAERSQELCSASQ
jgi:hypothetical protein